MFSPPPVLVLPPEDVLPPELTLPPLAPVPEPPVPFLGESSLSELQPKDPP
jgi:hypothetical protein